MMAVMPEIPPPDPFSKAVDKARQRLSYTRGRNISVRALFRSGGIPESTLAYSLSEKRAASGRRVDADIARKLAAVLPVDESDLMRAAQEAAGYRVREDAVVDPVAYVLDAVQAFYGNASITRASGTRSPPRSSGSSPTACSNDAPILHAEHGPFVRGGATGLPLSPRGRGRQR